MHPEMSLVLLTVLAGAGQGVFILLVALDSMFSGSGAVPAGYILSSGIVSIAFQAAGIIASTSHLGNPQRGWRAMLMVKNSWLSREVLTLSAAVGAAVLYVLMFYFGASAPLRLTVGLIGIAAGIGFYIASSMVYASITFVKEWANLYTPFNFLVFGITSGLGTGLAILNYTQAGPSIIATVNYLLIGLAIMSLLMKYLSYKFNAGAYVSVNIRNAVAINDPEIKLMDMGTTYDHYNTKEYFHPISEKCLDKTRFVVLTVAFGFPLIIWVISALNVLASLNTALTVAAAVLMIAGLVIERRLFFIQGNNIQNLYYANFRSTGARNPLESKARKGSPVPIS
jgi:DMSO reductase anchor subunit